MPFVTLLTVVLPQSAATARPWRETQQTFEQPQTKMEKNTTNEEIHKTLKEDEIDCSDIPPLDKEFWENAELVIPQSSAQLSQDSSVHVSRAEAEGEMLTENNEDVELVALVKERRNQPEIEVDINDL